MMVEVLALIEGLREEAMDFILATNEVGFAQKVADWIWFLAEDKICEAGAPVPVFSRSQNPIVWCFFERVLKS